MKFCVSRALVAVAAALLVPLGSHAQAFRAYLSSQGADNATCGVSTPCRLLPAALNAVADRGEIWILDSANFNVGTVTIGKNVIIQAIPGQVASIAPSNGAPAVVISPGFKVTLRNVSMVTSAASPGTDGIQMTTGSLNVEDSIFEVWGSSSGSPDGTAIRAAGTGTVSVRNSVFRHGRYGIHAANGARVEVSGSKFLDLGTGALNGAGIYVEGDTQASRLTVSGSQFVKCYFGLWLYAGAARSATMTLTRSTITHNAIAMYAQVPEAGASVIVTASNNNISNNDMGLYFFGVGGSSAIFEGMSDNILRNNKTGNYVSGPGASITTFVPY